MKHTLTILSILGVLIFGIHLAFSDNPDQTRETGPIDSANLKEAVFAGGCFWCTESDFEKIEGVVDAVSGYTGGQVQNPTYKQVSAGGTGHIESVRVIYDAGRVDYDYLLEVFWRSINPTDGGGQFVDRGPQYRSAIFYADAVQHEKAQASKRKLADSGVFADPIATEILPLGAFYDAEDYHQNYYKKNPLRYKFYRANSGRDKFLKGVWADRPLQKNPLAEAGGDRRYRKPEAAELRQRLTPLQYKVTQKEGTEPPFDNAYWDNKADGIYVDIVSGEPLFSSTDKFRSGTGWPSFTRPLEPGNIVQHQDRRLFMERIEVRSKHADSHLGHVFPDGPQPTGLRYCINSAALRFVPLADLEKEGYGQYKGLFENPSGNAKGNKGS